MFDFIRYFWTRFLFSATYLTRVSAPLALNLYTAVHNPITLEGRIQLCQGELEEDWITFVPFACTNTFALCKVDVD